MTDEEFEKLMAQARQEAERTRLPRPTEQDMEYAMLARHASPHDQSVRAANDAARTVASPLQPPLSVR